MENEGKPKRRVSMMHTGADVLRNIKYFREKRGLKLTDLRELLAGQEGKQLGVSALSEIENGARRVDVDDLMSIAAALNIPPNSLLLPREPTTVDEAQVPVTFATGWGVVDFVALWKWAEGKGSIDKTLFPWEPSREAVSTRPEQLDAGAEAPELEDILRVLEDVKRIARESYDGDD